MTEKHAGSRKATGNRDTMVGPSGRPSRITGRIPGLVPGPERALTRSGEPVKRKMTKTPKPKDKLDAATNVAVNGPEDVTLEDEQSVGVGAAGPSLGLLEPDARKRARPVLRGAGRSNAPGLPGLRRDVARL